MEKVRKLLGEDLHQSYFVIMICLGIIVGVIVGLVFRVNYFNSVVWIILALLVFIFIYLKPKYLFVGVAFGMGMVIAFYRVSSELKTEYEVRKYFGKNVVVSGEVKMDPDYDGESAKLRITIFSIGEDSGERFGGEIYVSARRNVDYMRGDKLKLKGKIEGGFGTYLGYMHQPEVVEFKRPEPGDYVVRARDWFSGRVKTLIEEPESSLGLSYLLGIKGSLPDELSDNLRAVGLTHMVVASGAHLSILVGIVRKIFGKLSRFASFLFSTMFIVVFMVMVGFTPSIVRAGVMSIINLGLWYVGRDVKPWRLILIVAAGTLVWQPNLIINLGWLLSFASYIGIMELGPRMKEYFYGGNKPGFIGGTILTTISATMMTLPIVLYFYGTTSLVSVAANLLLLPTLSFAMGLVFMSGVVAGVRLIGEAVGFIAKLLLDFHITVVGFFAEMKVFTLAIPAYDARVFLVYGVVLAPFLIGLIRQKMVKLREVRNYKLE